MSQALGVSASGFYEWLSRPESNRAMSNRALLVRIRESFEGSHHTYGSPRVWRDLRDWEVSCSENRVARLMRQAGLVARPRLKHPPFDLGQRSMIAPNILDRQFEARESDELNYEETSVSY
jgi:putative transposase